MNMNPGGVTQEYMQLEYYTKDGVIIKQNMWYILKIIVLCVSLTNHRLIALWNTRVSRQEA